MQLFCFTHAGGTSAFYDQIENVSNKDIEFIKLEYSGHGRRIKEPLYKDLNEAILDLYNLFTKNYDGGSYAFIGYSMGSLLAVCLLNYIKKNRILKLPLCIFLCAHSPKIIIDMNKVSCDNIDEYVKQSTIKFNAIPKSLINNKTYWRMFLPIYKSDYLLINNFDITKMNFKTSVPSIILYGKNDSITENVYLWDNYFVGENAYYDFDGDHFFIYNNINKVTSIIEKHVGF